MFEFMKRPKRMRFATLAELWLEDINGKVKESTRANYQTLLRKHLLPTFGPLYVRDLTTEQLAEFFSSMEENGLSPSTRRSIQLVLQMILRYGAATGNCDIMLFPALPTMPRGTVGTLTDEECYKLECWIEQNMTPCNLGILLCMYTGMRIGEICALRWGDINLRTGTVTIGRTLQRVTDRSGDGSHLMIASPKSRSGSRCIPVPRQILRELKRWAREPTDYVLTGTSDPMEPRKMQRKFKRCLELAEVRPVKFHTLRHTFATRCMATDLDPKTLSYILGHANVSTTMTVYVHPSLEQIRRCLDRLPEQKLA